MATTLQVQRSFTLTGSAQWTEASVEAVYDAKTRLPIVIETTIESLNDRNRFAKQTMQMTALVARSFAAQLIQAADKADNA